MIIETVKEYNLRRKQDWEKRCKEWDNTKGGFPNLCFYIFTNPITCEERTLGYVASDKETAVYRKTKRGAINMFKKLTSGG